MWVALIKALGVAQAALQVTGVGGTNVRIENLTQISAAGTTEKFVHDHAALHINIADLDQLNGNLFHPQATNRHCQNTENTTSALRRFSL